MNAFGIIGIMIGVTNVALSLLVYSQDRKNKLNRLWAIFTLSVSTWGFGAYAVSITQNPTTALFLWRLIDAGVIFIPISFLAFTYSFLDKKENLIIKIAGLIGAILLLIDATPYFITSVQFVFGSFYWNNPSIPYDIFVIFFTVTILYTLIIAFKYAFLCQDPIRKKQVFLFALASLVGFLGGMTSYLPAFGINLYPYLNVSIVVFSVIITYTIVKHKLFNIKIIAVQLVTMGLWIFILIRLTFTQNTREFITESTLFIISIIFGIFLIHAVFKELKQRERIEKLVLQLQDLNLTLNQKVAEQTQEVRHALESEKKARLELEKLNDAKDQFIMITQHHLRTPVTSVLWGLESSLKGEYGKLTNDLRAMLTEMLASGKRLMKIVDDFLNITAIKVGTNILSISSQSLKPSIDDILAELKPEIQSRNITVNQPAEETAWPSLPIDHDKIRESLFIVVENAIRYNHEGGSVDISTRIDRQIFELTIKNTGIGITREEASKIGSSLFYRGEGARRNHPIGMGIGLSVVKAIIKAHKGTFSIESNGKDQGATVELKLPIAIH